METGLERVLARAATIDELLVHRSPPGRAADVVSADRRLAAWCRASASGDWSLFRRRLARDGLSVDDVQARFAVKPDPSAPAPGWAADADWVHAALQKTADVESRASAAVAFGPLLAPVVRAAQQRLESTAVAILSDAARADLADALLTELSALSAPPLFERFAAAREKGAGYHDFVFGMRASGWRRLFEDKPVLLRLMTTLTRQWIDASHELITRLAADSSSIRRDLLGLDAASQVVGIEAGLSDPHNFGRSVQILRFADGTRVVYKPKDLCVDAMWSRLIERLNSGGAPVALRAMRVLTRPGYGWTEFIAHTSCADRQDFRHFYRRAGAWLALFHAFVGVDMHQENIVAAAAHPVPIDLEMTLQSPDIRFQVDDEADDGQAFARAMRTVIDSVLTVGMLPAYGRHSDGPVFAIGGVHSNVSPLVTLRWSDVNTDAMLPMKSAETVSTITNLPHVDGHRGRLGDHIDDLVSGFGDYARFLQRQNRQHLVDGFAGLTVRTVVRPTRFYTALLARLRDHRSMDDGVVWSAQADFVARLANWEDDADPIWALHRAERAALVDLNVPHFTTPADTARASARLCGLTDAEIGWQIELIRQNTDLLRGPASRGLQPLAAMAEPAESTFGKTADGLAASLSGHAIRDGRGAAWIGMDWLGDSEVSQLVVLGPDLYNGACGVALFLAAHAAVTGDASSAELARAATAGLRQHVAGRNPARMARSLGVGGALGLGSIVYGLAVIADLLDDGAILAAAHAAAELFTDDLIGADRRHDVLGGNAGAILGLLRLYRQTGSERALALADKCGTRLLAHERTGPSGRRTWAAGAFGRPLNGMSHGAAGFAYALQALSHATGRDEYGSAATECIAFEESTFDANMHGWADLRDMAEAQWPCKWCYGAAGIGLARIGMIKLAGVPFARCATDIGRALAGVEHGWPAATDNLCCGTLGSIEFVREAAGVTGRDELRDRATRWLLTVAGTAEAAGDFRWSSGTGRFNIGLFRGVAGVGYTLLRMVDDSLPNVLIWE